jgi:hypothetical protein
MAPEAMQASPPMVIISTSRQKGLKAWDLDDTDDQDDVYPGSLRDNPDHRNDSLYSTQQPIDDTTNRWDDPRDPDFKSIFSERRRDEAAGEDHLPGRLESENAAGRIDYGDDQRYGRHFGDSDGDLKWSCRTSEDGSQSDGTANKDLSAWARSLLHPASDGIDRSLTKQQRFTQMGMGDQNPLRGDSLDDSSRFSDRLPPNPALLPGAGAFAGQWGDRDRRTSEEMSREPLHYKDEYTNAMSQYSDLFSRQQPLAPPPIQVQSPPAILPFPKKPGSVF